MIKKQTVVRELIATAIITKKVIFFKIKVITCISGWTPLSEFNREL